MRRNKVKETPFAPKTAGFQVPVRNCRMLFGGFRYPQVLVVAIIHVDFFTLRCLFATYSFLSVKGNHRPL